MSWIKRIFSTSASSLLSSVKELGDEFNFSGEEKAQFQERMEALLQKRDSEVEQTLRAELGAKERVLVAELQQGDTYTKRARPTVVYFGLVVIFWNYCLVPLFGEPVNLPLEFWAAWGGICGTWVIGRSAEKAGVRNRAVQAVTGSRLLGDQ